MGAMLIDESIKAKPGIVNLQGVSRAGITVVPERDRSALKKTALISSRMVVDTIAMTAAVWVAYWLRFESTPVIGAFQPEFVPNMRDLFLAFVMGIPILLFFLNAFDLYDVYRHSRLLDQIPRILGAVNAYLVTMLVLTFLLKGADITRGFLIMFWCACVAFVLSGRTLLQLGLHVAGVQDVVMRNTLIIGSGEVGKHLALKLKKHHQFGLDPIGFVDDDPLYSGFEEKELCNLQVLGGLNDLETILHNYHVGKVIVAFSGVSHEQLLDLSATCTRLGVECSIVPRLFEVITNDIKITEVGGIPLIRVRRKSIRGVSRALKAVEDFVLASFIFLLVWPILLATAIAIKLDSPGPVFFRHRRIGRAGKPFNCLKFRSMVSNAEELQAQMVEEDNADWCCWKKKDDPRVTRVGKWIRRFSIDELPQIFNVLGGQMSLVGPRPHIQEEVDSYQEWHTPRLNVRPGITGIWQVSGRSDIPFDEMIKLDLYYIERWSLWQDCKILLRTVSAVLRRDGAY
jgi:exopolysaccharide biosynthesis polyprenyl glycosylphosphotransferase